MTHITGHDRSQTLLLPESLDEYVGAENPVALYIDGVYHGPATILLNEFNDVDHIEISKGPQGTLFGRNATAGAVQIFTKSASLDLVVRPTCWAERSPFLMCSFIPH